VIFFAINSIQTTTKQHIHSIQGSNTLIQYILTTKIVNQAKQETKDNLPERR